MNNNKNYTYILFDLDGTITDPGIGITNSVMYALKHFGITETERSKLYKFIGPPLADSFKDFYGFSDEQAQKAVQVYREYYTDKGIFELSLYDGIPELLRDLHATGKKVVLATSKPEIFARQILDHYNLSQYFSVIAGSDMAETRVKKGEVIAYALDLCGLTQQDDNLTKLGNSLTQQSNSLVQQSNTDCVMIGDRKHDIIGATQNKLDSIGVLFGYGGREELENAGATMIAQNVTELRELLNL